MFDFLRKNKESIPSAAVAKPGVINRFQQGLKKTRMQFSEGIAKLFLGKKAIDAELLAGIETQLLLADVGIEGTNQIIGDLTARISRKELADPEKLWQSLKLELYRILAPCEKPWELPIQGKPYVILLVGVNGAGKTTTIGKLANYLQAQDKRVILAAGDTFRAAAVEQLQIWGERNRIPVIAQQTGADSASVVYDGLQAAQARQMDVLLADTAGRLHTQNNLMEELKKVKRVMAKLDNTAPHETLLVLDASVGQNSLNQALQFHQALGVTGLVITKLDGTAKGGIVFAIAKALCLPIRFIGIGEGIDDLRPFQAQEFIDALLNQ